jgi:hypothetical protein
MNITEFSNELYDTMKEKISEVEMSGKDEISKQSSYIEIVKSHTYGLKNFLYQYTFETQEEEISFFKHIKPKFVSLLLFHNDFFEIEISRPLEKEALVRHYQDSLHKGQTFINANLELYKYYHFNYEYLDSKYFLSDCNKETGSDVMFDSRFCTPFDHKFCMIKAYELLREQISRCIEQVQNGTPGIETLKWTGQKSSLIELMYALQVAGVFNRSSSDIKAIAIYFQKAFNIDLGNYYRTLKDIQIRKGGSKTHFLDELKYKLTEKLEEELTPVQ